MAVQTSRDAGRRHGAPADATSWDDAGITFASAADAARYRRLAVQHQVLEGQVVAVEHAMEAVLARASWSLAALMEREG